MRSKVPLLVAVSCCTLATLAGTANAQTAEAGVRVFRPPASTLQFPGEGTNTLRFAAGTFTQGTGTATGSASAGRGSLSAFAASSSLGFATGSFRSLATESTASLTDSFTITADTTLPLRLEFGMRATGNVSISRSNTSANGANSGFAQVEWSVAVTGGGNNLSQSGRVSEQHVLNVVNGVPIVSVQRIEQGLSFSEFSLVIDLGSGSAGQTMSISMSALARASYNAGNIGDRSSGVADFGSTLRWLGLTRATFLDGTPFEGTIQISSASGFDYTVPSPGAAGFLFVGALVCGTRRRR